MRMPVGKREREKRNAKSPLSRCVPQRGKKEKKKIVGYALYKS